MGCRPTRAALLTAPMAVATGVLAPFVGKLVDRAHPRPIVGFGFSAVAIALTWLSIEMTPTTPIWRLVLPFVADGCRAWRSSGHRWPPPPPVTCRRALAGAGSGVYNATRQVGSVLGSAGMAAFMTSRISAEMPGGGQRPAAEGSVTKLPAVPARAVLGRAVAVAAAARVRRAVRRRRRVVPARVRRRPDSAQAEFDDGARRTRKRSTASRSAGYDYFPDDDEYVEYTIDWDEPYPPRRAVPQQAAAPEVFSGDESDTEVLRVHVEHPLHAPAESWHGGPVETWHSLLDDELSDDPVEVEPPPAPYAVPIVAAEPVAAADVHSNGDRPWRSILDDLLGDMPAPPTWAPEPIGFAHNGFHVDHEQHFQVPPSGGRAQRPRTARPRRRRRRGNLRPALDAVPRLAANSTAGLR